MFYNIPIIDWAALLFFVISWISYAHYADRQSSSSHTLLAVTNRYRVDWLKQMLIRENRTMDAIMVGNLLRSISFFANTTIFILLGLMTLLGYSERVGAVLSSIPLVDDANSTLLFELKVFLLIVIFIYAFFKYTWALRQYNYAGIFINSCPPATEREMHDFNQLAERGGYIVSSAARHFNNGLRAYYFGLAALSWFLNPYLFIAATTWVLYVTHRREFRSGTLKALS